MSPFLMTLFVVTASPSAELQSDRNVVYAEVDGVKLKMDIVRPKTSGPHPTAVGFHGGAWKHGSKDDLSRVPDESLDFGGTGNRSLLDVIAEHGYVAVSVQYRLAPKHKWPAQIEDAKTAIRFLRENAKKYDINPDKIGAFGFSAGGHLAALLGTVTKDAGLEGTLYPEQSSAVQCVVDYFGPTDMSLFTAAPGIEAGFMVPLLGARIAAKPQVYKEASPLYHVKKTNSPFLIVHGTADVIVPIIHSERFHDKLVAAGVSSKMIPIKGKGHGWSGDTAIETRTEAFKFFDEQFSVKK
jgi:acetyl esterase/lipase